MSSSKHFIHPLESVGTSSVLILKPAGYLAEGFRRVAKTGFEFVPGVELVRSTDM